MSSIAFLFVAVVLSVVGCSLLLLRHRKPTSLEDGIDSFRREMRALAPDKGHDGPRRRGLFFRPPPPAGDDRSGR